MPRDRAVFLKFKTKTNMKKFQKVYAICEQSKVVVGAIINKKTFDELDGTTLISYEIKFLDEFSMQRWQELPSTEIFVNPADAFAELESRFETSIEFALSPTGE